MGFFKLDRGDGLFIAGLILFAAAAFLPAVRGVTLGGMSLLGWLMAALMIASPLIALARIAKGKGGRDAG